MEPLYASSCHGQFDVISCRLLVRSGTFGPTLLVGLTVFCALLTQFVFTSPLLRGIYGTKFAALTPAEQRRVGLLHVGIVMKVWGFVFIAVPSYRIIVQGQYWDEQGLVPGMTLADMATTSVMAFGALGLFDLIYSESLRPIYLLHHLGTLVFLHGYLYMVMSLPTAPEKSAEGLERLALLVQICLTWVLFSSIGSIISRLTYLIRQLGPSSWFRHLHRVFLTGLAIFSFLSTLEVVVIAFLIFTNRDRLSSAAPAVVSLFQVVFTATKIKTAQRILSVYRRQAQEVVAADDKHRAAAPADVAAAAIADLASEHCGSKRMEKSREFSVLRAGTMKLK